MERRNELTIDVFLAVVEMVSAQMRIKREDRWTAAICQLKFSSFRGQFPEVDGPQLLWSAEQFLQSDRQGFQEFPTWGRLMAPLFRSEQGIANRSWGYRDNLPAFIKPTAKQLKSLPSAPSTVLPPPEGADPAAYAVLPPAAPLALPPAAEHSPLTEEKFARFLAGEDIDPEPAPPPPPPAIKRLALPLLTAAELAQAEAAVRRSR